MRGNIFCMQGNILMYAAFIKTATVTVTEAKGIVTLPINVFKYPPGKEPNKTVDDDAGGRKTLPEKEENPTSVKVSAQCSCKSDFAFMWQSSCCCRFLRAFPSL